MKTSDNDIKTFALPDHIIAEKDTLVVMSDGVKLSANVFRPEKEGKHPVILACTPYSKDVSPDEYEETIEVPGPGASMGCLSLSEATPFEAPDPAFWVPEGYVVIHADVRGYFKSGGMPGLLSKRDEKDFYELIEWAAAQSWSNGNVALNGVSYLAIFQWFAAATRPPGLKAIVPWEGVSDSYRDLLFHGGIPETRFLNFYFGMMRSMANGFNPIIHLPSEKLTPYLPRLAGRLTTKARLEKIDVPALVCASWSDQGLHTRGSFEGYRRISSQQKWLFTHGRAKWEAYYSDEALSAQKAFYDHFLKGIDNGLLDSPRVRIEVRKTIKEYDVRYENEFPINRTEYTRLFLNATKNSLETEQPQAESTAMYDSSGDDNVSYDIVFDKNTEITGYIKLRLWVSAESANDMDLFIGLKKLDQNGDEVFFYGNDGIKNFIVSTGWLRVSWRELNASRSTEWRPVLKMKRRKKLKQGEIVPVDIEILPSSTFFEKGERLKLLIQGSDIIKDSSILHEHSINKGRHLIHSGGQYDSYLLIPVIP